MRNMKNTEIEKLYVRLRRQAKGDAYEIQKRINNLPLTSLDKGKLSARHWVQGGDTLTAAQLGALRNLAERAKTGKISPQKAKQEAEKIDPNVGKLFDIANWPGQAKATLYASIIGAVAMITAAKIATSPTQTTVTNPTVIERIIEPPSPNATDPRKHDRGRQSKERSKKRR
jgi:hypothetical protein